MIMNRNYEHSLRVLFRGLILTYNYTNDNLYI